MGIEEIIGTIAAAIFGGIFVWAPVIFPEIGVKIGAVATTAIQILGGVILLVPFTLIIGG